MTNSEQSHYATTTERGRELKKNKKSSCDWEPTLPHTITSPLARRTRLKTLCSPSAVKIAASQTDRRRRRRRRRLSPQNLLTKARGSFFPAQLSFPPFSFFFSFCRLTHAATNPFPGVHCASIATRAKCNTPTRLHTCLE